MEKFLRNRTRRGVAFLTFTIVLTILIAIGTILMVGTTLDQARMNERRRDLWRAYLHAEAGIPLVQHWAAYPDDYTVDTSLFAIANETGTIEEQYSNLNLALAAADPDEGYLIAESNLESMGAGSFTTATENAYLGKLREIRLFPPSVSDPVPCFFRLEAIGESSSGRERGVIAYLDENPVVEVALPAALISLTSAELHGNANVHWGEAWSKTDMQLSPRPEMIYILNEPDTRVVYRTEELIIFPSNFSTSTLYQAEKLYNLGKTIVSPNPNEMYVLPSLSQPGLYPSGQGDWQDVFFQNVTPGTLQFPDLLSEYEAFKSLAIANNRYYTTNEEGEILKSGTPIVSWMDEFGSLDISTSAYDLVFIDTTNGSPPDGTNLATITVSGNNHPDGPMGLKGMFYINANFDLSGVGEPPFVNVPHPDGGSQSMQVYLDGVLYVSGTIDFAGDPIIFGSVVAEEGFSGEGSPDIYYNEDLSDGLVLGNGNVGAPFRVVLRSNFAP